jgi:hypothetical protein
MELDFTCFQFCAYPTSLRQQFDQDYLAFFIASANGIVSQDDIAGGVSNNCGCDSAQPSVSTLGVYIELYGQHVDEDVAISSITTAIFSSNTEITMGGQSLSGAVDTIVSKDTVLAIMIQTKFPTVSPTVAPILNPTIAPTLSPATSDPTVAPSPNPTFSPTVLPTVGSTPNSPPSVIDSSPQSESTTCSLKFSIKLNGNKFKLKATSGKSVLASLAAPLEIVALHLLVDGRTVNIAYNRGGTYETATVGYDSTGRITEAGALSTDNFVVHSEKTCGELGWKLYKGNTAVCGASTINGACWTDSASATSFEVAKSICDSAGSRLCTLQEVRQKATLGSGCRGDFRNIWTSTICASGHFVTRGSGNELLSNGNPSTRCEEDTLKKAVRCCADVAATPSGGILLP